MEDKELEELLKQSSFELIKEVLEDTPRKSPEEAAKDWYSCLDGVKFSDWGKDLFRYSTLIKEIDIPSELFINCFERKDKAEHRLVDYIQKHIKNRKNWFFYRGEHIRELFIKLESRSPKDYLQDYPRTIIKPVISGKDIVDALLGSLRTFEDLCFLVKLKNTVKLYIRPFFNFYQPFEWRVFVKNGEVIGISKQFYNESYDYKEKYLLETKDSIECFMKNICIPNIKIKDFVVDLYVNPDNKYWVGKKQILETTIIETNPYGLSDPCLFKSYKELESTNITFRYNKE